MSLTTSKTIYRAGYQPLMPGVFVAPFPYSYRYGWDEAQTSQWCLEELEYLFATQTAPQETAAVLIESVLGEGGYVVPPASFMRGLRSICDRYDILLISDEIQSGFGRTGRWFGFEHFDFIPDIMAVAKGMASGLPLSGVFSRMELMKKWPAGTHGGTYGGNAVACAAAVATIQAMRDEGMVTNAQERGVQLMTGLRHLQEEYPQIGDVRGLGLMIGAEFRREDRKPDRETAKAVVHACQEDHLLLLTCGPWDNTIRFIPPLVVTESQINQGLEIFSKVLKKVL
jgi:4-aminobutyrate aminotransferase